jgi:uncharacterized membrane protein YtjA (UPF0391 family)
MLSWAILFLILAVIAAVLGFGGFVAGTLLFAAKLCAFVFLVLFVLSFFFGRNTIDTPGPY